MSIDEAIERCETLATKGHIIFSRDPDIAEECNEKYKQLAEWLEELKMLRELKEEHRKIGNIEGFNKGYNKAIDDFVNACKEDISCQTFGLHINGIERIAEQLKSSGNNEELLNGQE